MAGRGGAVFRGEKGSVAGFLAFIVVAAVALKTGLQEGVENGNTHTNNTQVSCVGPRPRSPP